MSLSTNIGKDIHQLASILWPINRSITGNGVRQTLAILQGFLPEIVVHKAPVFSSSSFNLLASFFSISPNRFCQA